MVRKHLSLCLYSKELWGFENNWAFCWNHWEIYAKPSRKEGPRPLPMLVWCSEFRTTPPMEEVIAPLPLFQTLQLFGIVHSLWRDIADQLISIHKANCLHILFWKNGTLLVSPCLLQSRGWGEKHEFWTVQILAVGSIQSRHLAWPPAPLLYVVCISSQECPFYSILT